MSEIIFKPFGIKAQKVQEQRTKNIISVRNHVLPIKCQCCAHIETSQLICCANQFTGFYTRANWHLMG